MVICPSKTALYCDALFVIPFLFSHFSFPCRYGFSRARYVYALISGVGIFILGAGATVYHGIISIIHPPTLAFLPAVSY